MSALRIVEVVATVFFVGLFLAVLLIDYWWKRKNPPEKLAAEFKALEKRLLTPDWAFYEAHLQRPAPAALRDLFADHPLVTSGDLKYSKSASAASTRSTKIIWSISRA
jgi:hypothetical protein